MRKPKDTKSSISRLPAKDAAVVIGAISDEMRSRLAKAANGTIAPMANVADTLLVQAKPGDPRKLFEKLNDVVGEKAVVAPVLVDEEGQRLFPTGHVQVRFKTPADDELLAAFAERHRLQLTKRNRWAPQQAEFAVKPDDPRYLPEITRAVQAEPAVDDAWPDVRAAFRRQLA